MKPQDNAITAAIAHLGGRATGTKKIATLLDLTTTRVYQLRKDGIVQKVEHALILSRETGIPFDAFLIRDRWKSAPTPNGKRHRDTGRKASRNDRAHTGSRYKGERPTPPPEQTHVVVDRLVGTRTA